MKQQLIRVLVYEGTPEFIQLCLKGRWVKKSLGFQDGIIREKIVGHFSKTPFDSEQAEPESFSTPVGSPIEEADDFSALR